MEKDEKFQRKKIEKPKYINQNCWLVKALNYAPYERCRYCELKFRNCLFLHYQIISSILIIFFLVVSFLIEGKISKLIITSIFTFVIVYGYFFSKSTDKIVQAYFAQRKTSEELKELTEKLEEKVSEQTKKLREAYEKLKVLDKAKSEFISIVSHQLRTPLGITKGYISMMFEGTYGSISQKIEKPLKNIYSSNERLIRLINDLLNVSRIESGKIKINLERVTLKDFTELISSVVAEFKMPAKRNNLSLTFIKPTKKLPQSRLSIDKNKVRQVISNFIDNAIKYTKQGSITIKTEVLPAAIRVKIEDTGAGMKKEEIEGLFKSFARGSVGVRVSTEGLGLGLYVAKMFAEMHHGNVWAESKGKDKGSIFYLELPFV
ncbi:MAG: HAMP domain-containing sensor histidine kinase [Candidatus Nealsonbacteria bacterium]